MTSPTTGVPGQTGTTPGPAPGDPDAYLWPRPEDFPDPDKLVLEDGKPVDNIFSEKQMRLLTEALHAGWTGPPGGQPFVVMANVGVFHTAGQPPLVPDVLLAVGVTQGDPSRRENLAYLVWLRGKVPDVVIEVVSNREGGEDSTKLQEYARIGVPYYVIFDPENELRGGLLRTYQLQGRTYQPLAPPGFFAEIGLGVDLWQGRFEDMESTWLRWRDGSGQLVPTGVEQAERERQRAEGAEHRATAEHQRAERARQELEELKAKARALGISM
jgi:hypothetical protein